MHASVLFYVEVLLFLGVFGLFGGGRYDSRVVAGDDAGLSNYVEVIAVLCVKKNSVTFCVYEVSVSCARAVSFYG